MSKLTGSVGAKGRNRPGDVKKVVKPHPTRVINAVSMSIFDHSGAINDVWGSRCTIRPIAGQIPAAST